MKEVPILYEVSRGGEDMPITKAQQRAVDKYVKQNYDRIEVKFPKGTKERIKEHAETRGESVNGFIGRAIQNQIERDNAAPDNEK